MFYIHQSTCISAQKTFGEINLEHLNISVNNQLPAVEPAYAGISPGHLRRMGKAVRMGVGAGIALLQQQPANGIIIGSANGGIEDSIKFLNQIIEYHEGTLTPTNFVQSTNNAIAGQLGMLTGNKGYNATHVHRGASFENAMLDAAMALRENPHHSYLVGGVDEISVRNYHMESMAGWYKKEAIENTALYDTVSEGSLPGEGAAMFIVNNIAAGAVARISALKMLNTFDDATVLQQLHAFTENNIAKNKIDLLLSGENGDSRFIKFYQTVEQAMAPGTAVARFKHATGEFQTASAIGAWLACRFLQQQVIPPHFIKSHSPVNGFGRLLFYNNYKGWQHTFMLAEVAA